MKPTNDTIPYGFCHCGCGKKTNIVKETDHRKGAIKGEPRRFLKSHHRARVDPIANRYTVDPHTGCWNWNDFRDKHGYGRLTVGGRTSQLAHVVSFVRVRGPVPEGLELDHLCENPSCINPDHLDPVTHKVNCQRGKRWRRPAEGDTHAKNL